MAVAPLNLTCSISPHDPLLLNRVQTIAQSTNRPTRPLHLQALLQLPRVADTHGFAPIARAEPLIRELAEELPPNAEWFVPNLISSPRALRFSSTDSDKVYDMMERFHYIRSPRTDGRAYALSTRDDRLVGLCISSPLDVAWLQRLLALTGRRSGFARVISRVFLFEGAPRNSISYLLSRAARAERHLGVTDFITYVNPNMGFTGSSYRASGWCPLGIESGTKYRYIDERYITDRELAAKFGTRSDPDFQRLLGSRFAVSVMPLEPLLVFHIALL